MIRKIIRINEEECNGCGICAESCHEGAIGMVAGKAKLLRDDYCDGFGNCLPVCPMDAISFEEREAAPFDADAVHSHLHVCGMSCSVSGCQSARPKLQSELRQWPIRISAMPETAPYFHNANLLIAGDCTAFAYANFHRRFIRNHVALIGCANLEKDGFTDRLTEIFRRNSISSVTVVKMETPCCANLVQQVMAAITRSCRIIPWHVETITIDGDVLYDSEVG